MPAKEIKELRQAGMLEEALKLAKAEMEAEPENIWSKRNISWVYYEYLKKNSTPEHFDSFISWLEEIKNLQLPEEEKMLFEKLCWQVGKMAFGLLKCNPIDTHKSIRLFETIQSFHFPKPSEGYSFLFKALHKSLKETDHYLQFADWWDFKNFTLEDFQKEKMPNGKEVMALAEQGHIAYAKHLLPKKTQFGEIIFNKERASAFLPVLSEIVDNYPAFQYPAYFNAKLLLALGNKDNMLESLLPCVKKKRNDFWVWEILSEAFSNDPEKVFACYCKALTCKSPEEMLVSLRQKIADLLIAKKFYNEAKTEIDLLVKARTEHGYRIPNEVVNWQATEWYKNANASKSTYSFYKGYISIAEGILFSDVPEELAIVEFVNSDKKMLNFIASESKFGFFKYERFLIEAIKVGDILNVRFHGGSKGGMYQLHTAEIVKNELFKNKFTREFEGQIQILEGKNFGFVEDIYIHPKFVNQLNLNNKDYIKGTAIKSIQSSNNKNHWKLLNFK